QPQPRIEIQTSDAQLDLPLNGIQRAEIERLLGTKRLTLLGSRSRRNRLRDGRQQALHGPMVEGQISRDLCCLAGASGNGDAARGDTAADCEAVGPESHCL